MIRLVAIAIVLGLASPAVAKGHPGVACIDSYGTVIEGVDAPGTCKQLGARWAKPGSKSLPKEEKAPKASKHASHDTGRHHGRSRYANK